ncbi:hypothetical protein [Agrobacterium fabrum]|uniref:hypothetical protein n=1 Tax=Agrobacterium fabrum TaxID=1176649 RepID=UPI00000D2834|nr:hypothetical protein [Agrobacterium fabrum]MCR6723369.1 hypothetical protein [Agrobacterium fabrum]UXT56101.1 hypothetical protein FY134_00440 [Agrobacterium fabrum]WIE27552.1 hypothetical protein G6L42_000440 [Agrobacterium fabrum]WIE43511.1 hypothetical protein G6L76_000440 [Agrobacterium fabrum]WLP54030.1 hypothetical protein Q8X45_00450 [Agrobacterium fabrum]
MIKLSTASGTRPSPSRYGDDIAKEKIMNQIIYIVGLVVIVLAILSFFGFR